MEVVGKRCNELGGLRLVRVVLGKFLEDLLQGDLLHQDVLCEFLDGHGNVVDDVGVEGHKLAVLGCSIDTSLEN